MCVDKHLKLGGDIVGYGKASEQEPTDHFTRMGLYHD